MSVENLPAVRSGTLAARRKTAVVMVRQPADVEPMRRPAVRGGPSLSSVVGWFGGLSSLAAAGGIAAYHLPHLL